LAAAALIFQSVSGIVRMHQVPTLAELIHVLYQIGTGLSVAAFVWVLYMTLEPYLRRRWPQSLISWTRLLAGDARDPLVAGHILIGTALGVGNALLLDLGSLFEWQRLGVPNLYPTTINALDGAGLASYLLGSAIFATAFALFIFVFLFLLRLVIRNTWMAAAVYVAFFASLVGLAVPDPLPSILLVVVQFSAGLWVMMRFGLLPQIVLILVQNVGGQAPLTSDLSAWYVSKGLIVVGLALALAVWSFRHALGGRKVLKGDFLEQ
jgi:serine/threonine-protein kinase